MAFCAKCGTQVAEGVAFCSSCGAGQGAGASGAVKPGGLESNVAGALAYLWLIAIVWLVLEPYNKDRFIRFHSFQAIGLGVVAFVVSVALSFLVFIPILGWIAAPIWGLTCLVAWAVCIFKAFNKEMFKLPVIGDFAEKQAGPA
jgi:uncharacterized membrane protein